MVFTASLMTIPNPNFFFGIQSPAVYGIVLQNKIKSGWYHFTWLLPRFEQDQPSQRAK